MKNLKKAIALLLALTMLLCLGGCGSFEKKMAKAAAKMSRLNSMHMDMDVELGMDISVMGQSMEMEMSVDAGIDMNMEPYAAKMDLNVKALGVSQNMQIYVIDEDGARRSYSSDDGGKTWTKGEAEDIDLDSSSLNAKDALALLAKWAESFVQDGEEKINGSAATKYSGEIEAEYLMEALELTGAKDKLEEILGADIDAVPDGIGNMPVSIWIDNKSSMIVRMEMDMTTLMQGILAQFLDETISSSLADAGLEGLPMEMGISKAVATMEYSQFDQVPAIELPEGVK